MKLFLAIAVVAVFAVIVLAMQRSGPRVTTITRRREVIDDEGDRDNA